MPARIAQVTNSLLSAFLRNGATEHVLFRSRDDHKSSGHSRRGQPALRAALDMGMRTVNICHGLIAGPHSDMPATELVAPMPPSAPADHLACSEKPSASWRQRGGLAACGAALVFLASIHGDRGSGEKPCAAIGQAQGAAGRDDARGRPAAFRSAARPAAPGALMPTTAGFVVDEDAAVFLV